MTRFDVDYIDFLLSIRIHISLINFWLNIYRSLASGKW